MLSKTNGKGPWSFDEDNKLLEWVKVNGPQKWSLCSETIPGRSGKQCRERWFNNLNPNVKKGNWTADEDDMIFQGYLQHGSSWSRIAKNLEGRTENSVKNRFYSTVRKLLSDSEKNGGKSSEQQIRNIIEMSLGKKVGGGIPFNNKNEDSDKESQYGSDNEDDKSQKEDKIGQNDDDKSQDGESSKANKSCQGNSNDGEQEDHRKKGNEQLKSKNQTSLNSDNKKKIKSENTTSNAKSEMEIEDKEDQKQGKSEGLIKDEKESKNEEDIMNKKSGENHGDDDESSNQQSSSQQLQGGIMKRKYNRKRHQDEYSESNLLYRLLKSNDVTIKNTKCLQDYSVFYRKYKQNKYMLKKKKKEDDMKNQYGDEQESSQRAESGDDYKNDDIEDEEIEKHYKLAQQQFIAQSIEKNSKKNSKGKNLKASMDQKMRQFFQKDNKHIDQAEDSNQDQDDEHHQMLLLQQKLNQQNKLESKLKQKMKNIQIPEVKIEDQGLNKSSTKYKNVKNPKSKHNNPTSDDEDDENHQQSMSQDNDEEDNSDNGSAQNDDEERDINSCIPSENQLDDVGEIEQQLLKYFQKSMGQFFKNFIKKQKVGSKETEKEKKSTKVKELKKHQAQQQQQLLQLQIQEQIQEQLKQLNSQNGGSNQKQSKNSNSSSQAIQRANTIIQNPPLKNSAGGKKSVPQTNPEVASFEKQLQKQIQEIQYKEPQTQNKELKSSFDTVKVNQKQIPIQQNAQQQQQSQLQQQLQSVDKGNQISSQNNFQSQKSSFQLKNNANIGSSIGGYHPLGSSSSLFSQPNASGMYGLGNNVQDLNSSLHNLQTQQQGQAESSQSAVHNMSLENLKSLISQNKANVINSGGQGNQQASNGEQGVDQKMIFLLNQLNTLESMLTNTKKELVKLEASLNTRNGDNFTQQQQNSGRGGYTSNSLQNSCNNLFGQSNFYPFQNGIPLTASILNTLPSFGSRAAFDKSENGNAPFPKRKNSKDNTSQFSDFDKFINNNN